MLFKYTLYCIAGKYYTVSPVEAHALYDGQLVPACDWQLFLAAFCCKDTTQFKFRDMILVAGLFSERFCDCYLLRYPHCPALWQDSSYSSLHQAEMSSETLSVTELHNHSIQSV